TPQRLRLALLGALAAVPAFAPATPSPASAPTPGAQAAPRAQGPRQALAAPRAQVASRKRPARRPPSAPRCVPGTLNRSAVLPGTSLAVSPLPGSYDASPRTQISLLGAPPGALSAVSARGSHSGWHPGRLRAFSQGDGASFVPSKPFRSGEA